MKLLLIFTILLTFSAVAQDQVVSQHVVSSKEYESFLTKISSFPAESKQALAALMKKHFTKRVISRNADGTEKEVEYLSPVAKKQDFINGTITIKLSNEHNDSLIYATEELLNDYNVKHTANCECVRTGDKVICGDEEFVISPAVSTTSRDIINKVQDSSNTQSPTGTGTGTGSKQ